MDVEELERLLPPSRYPTTATASTHTRGTNGDGGSVTSSSQVNHSNNNGSNNNVGNSSPSHGAHGQGQGITHPVIISRYITNISCEYHSIVINDNVTVTDPPTLLTSVPYGTHRPQQSTSLQQPCTYQWRRKR